jgi:hypothetical protein
VSFGVSSCIFRVFLFLFLSLIKLLITYQKKKKFQHLLEFHVSVLDK